MMFCEGPAGEVEAAYFANLANVAMWANTGGSLVLQDATGEPILNYLAAVDEEPIPAEALEGPTWLLAEQATEGGMVTVPEGILVTLTLLGRPGRRQRRLQQLLRGLRARRHQPHLQRRSAPR